MNRYPNGGQSLPLNGPRSTIRLLSSILVYHSISNGMRSARALWSHHGLPTGPANYPMTAGEVGFGATREARQRGGIYVWVEDMLESRHCLQPLPIQPPFNSNPQLCIHICTEILKSHRTGASSTKTISQSLPSHHSRRRSSADCKYIPRHICSPQPDARQLEAAAAFTLMRAGRPIGSALANITPSCEGPLPLCHHLISDQDYLIITRATARL